MESFILAASQPCALIPRFRGDSSLRLKAVATIEESHRASEAPGREHHNGEEGEGWSASPTAFGGG
ncbi:hypothetical protein Acsp06_11390 [Actinomycetospora sp. NBRC 106375]|nr:hypothetical protein Acsp06_11390 [Actinomycetospora sp. NBRC 106375]